MSWGGIFPLHTGNKEASERARVGEGQGPQACLCPGRPGPWKHKIALWVSPGVLTSCSQSKGILLLNKSPPFARCSGALHKESDLLASPSWQSANTGRHSSGLVSRGLEYRPESIALCWVT